MAVEQEVQEITSRSSPAAYLGWGWLTVTLGLALLMGCGQFESTPSPTPTSTPPPVPAVTSELVISASFPVTMAFAPDGRLFYNEFAKGNIQTLLPGESGPRLFAHVDSLALGECGLVGVALDPEFERTGYVYVYYIEPVESDSRIGHPVIVRFTDVDGQGQEPTVLLDDLPTTNPIICGHVSGNLHFGPDGYLYLSIGEMELKEPAQDVGSPLGKILRLRKEDGLAAPDNPFVGRRGADDRVFAYGLRNPFDFTFHPETGRLYESENGPSNCDEINIIVAGEYYGHPESYTDAEKPPCLERAGVPAIYLPHKPGMRPEEFGSNAAPVGIQFVSGEVYPSLGDTLLYCEFNTGFMRRLALAGPSLDRVVDDSVVVEDCFLDIATSPDGIVYYSNQREIRRLVPEAVPQ